MITYACLCVCVRVRWIIRLPRVAESVCRALAAARAPASSSHGPPEVTCSRGHQLVERAWVQRHLTLFQSSSVPQVTYIPPPPPAGSSAPCNTSPPVRPPTALPTIQVGVLAPPYHCRSHSLLSFRQINWLSMFGLMHSSSMFELHVHESTDCTTWIFHTDNWIIH